MTLGTSCQYTLLIPERLFPSRSAIPAILLYFHPTPPRYGFRQMPPRGCSVALGAAAPDLGTAPERVGNPGIPGRGLLRIPRPPGPARSPVTEGAASRPSGHAGNSAAQENGPRASNKAPRGRRGSGSPSAGRPPGPSPLPAPQRRTKRGCTAAARPPPAVPGASECGRR